jgi:AAA15 family ATPase/GTPase
MFLAGIQFVRFEYWTGLARGLVLDPRQKDYAKQHRAKMNPIKFSNSALTFEQSKAESHFLRVLLTHSGKSAANFNLEDESQGTQRLYEMSPVLFELERTPCLFVIDELDSSLHPKLVRFFIERFLAHRIAGAQILTTTHDASLLDLGLLRRDEIWFADKNERGKTQLASLHEFINRSDVDLDKHYLAGRFNGIPRLKKVRVSQSPAHKADA